MHSSASSKKMHCIFYDFCLEAVAAEIIRIVKKDTTNLADLFVKVLTKHKREE